MQPCANVGHLQIDAVAPDQAHVLLTIPQTFHGQTMREPLAIAGSEYLGGINAHARVSGFPEYGLNFGIGARFREARQYLQHAALHVTLVGVRRIPAQRWNERVTHTGHVGSRSVRFEDLERDVPVWAIGRIEPRPSEVERGIGGQGRYRSHRSAIGGPWSCGGRLEE